MSETTTDATTTTAPVEAKVKADAKAKKAKATAKKPAVKAKAKATKTANRAAFKLTAARREAYAERAESELKEKAENMSVSKKGSITEKLQQATALFLVQYRKKNNLSAGQLAAKVKVDPTTISHLESGERGLIRLDRIVELSKALAIKPADMAAAIINAAL